MTKDEIAAKIRKLAGDLDAAWDEEKDFQLSEDKVCEVEEGLRLLACGITGHEWTMDQCGQWHHQFCYRCQSPKHPTIGKLSCSEFAAKYDKMTEKEWYAKNHQRETRPQEQIRYRRSLVGP